VFELTPEGLELTEVAPRDDIERTFSPGWYGWRIRSSMAQVFRPTRLVTAQAHQSPAWGKAGRMAGLSAT
jgi:hypothetical protein